MGSLRIRLIPPGINSFSGINFAGWIKMRTINCDINHIGDGIKMLNNHQNDIKYLNIWDSDCVMRGIPLDEMKERNILASDPDQVAKIEYCTNSSFRFHFHQSEVDYLRDFRFCPYNSEDCTPPEDLGERLELVVAQIEDLFSEVVWSFAGVEAQSYGREGHLTDFEFEYDLMVW